MLSSSDFGLLAGLEYLALVFIVVFVGFVLWRLISG
jgi:hypothetical protein